MKKSVAFIVFGLLVVSISLFGFKKIIKKETRDETLIVQTQENKIDDASKILEENRQKRNVENVLIAGGDVIPSRWVGVKIRASGDSAMPFRKIAPLMSSGDITFINYEAPFFDKGPLVTEGMVFKAEPDFIEGLTLAGIDVVSLANNHIKNQGDAGMKYTFSHLEKNNIKYSGAGENFEAAHQPAILESKGIKFGFLAYTYSDGIKFTRNSDPNTYDLSFLEVEQMKQDVEKLKKEVDVVVVSMHAGVEYTATPNQDQQDFAHSAIDAGAKLVLGHHPHWVQITEKYNNGFIIYGLGNLVFDQMWSEETREGVIAKINFQGARLMRAEFTPIKIEDYSQPRFTTEAESKKTLKQMQLESNTIEF